MPAIASTAALTAASISASVVESARSRFVVLQIYAQRAAQRACAQQAQLRALPAKNSRTPRRLLIEPPTESG